MTRLHLTFVVAIVALLGLTAQAQAQTISTSDVTANSFRADVGGLDCGTEYTVTVGGQSQTVTTAACPIPDPPTASFSVSPASPTTGQQATFTSTGTCPATPCTYTWEDEGPDGPDGTDYPWGTGPTHTRSFAAVGTKYAHLTVTDARDRTADARQNVSVTAPQPPPPPPAACANGTDDDADGLVDMADPGCSGPADTDESNVVNPPPSGSCDRNATPSTLAAQVSAATAGQTICLATGNYGTWQGTNKAITLKAADGATPTMRFNFGSGDSGFTVDGVSGAGGSINGGVSNITVRNSAFNTCFAFNGSNSNVLFDNNTHNNIEATCGNARIRFEGSGMTVRNSDMIGGDSDGTFVGSGGAGFLFENNYVSVCEGATGNHTDGLQYAARTDPAGSAQGVVRGNFFDFKRCPEGYGQALSSYDGGTRDELWEDNVIDTTRPFGIELYADVGSTVRHNTVRYYPDSACVFNGLTCGRVQVTHKTGAPRSTGTQVYNNVATQDFTDSQMGRVENNTSPATVSYVGPLTTWAGFKLTPDSPGQGTGIRVP